MNKELANQDFVVDVSHPLPMTISMGHDNID